MNPIIILAITAIIQLLFARYIIKNPKDAMYQILMWSNGWTVAFLVMKLLKIY